MFELKPLELSDKPIIDKYLKTWDFDSSELIFSNLYIWKDASKPMFCEKDGFLYFCYYSRSQMAFFPPIPLDREADFLPAITNIEKYMKQQGWEVAINKISEALRGKIENCCPGKFAFSENRDYEDYVYLSEDLRTLSGKKLHAKRNHINKFLMMYGKDYEYASLEKQNIEECIDLYDEWMQKKSEDSEEYANERKALVSALENMEALELKGCIIRISGKVQGFSVGTRLNSNTAIIHIEKANDEIAGIYSFINQQFVEHVWKDYQYINREEDMGIPGLRRAKMSYNPVRIVRKFQARLSEDYAE